MSISQNIYQPVKPLLLAPIRHWQQALLTLFNRLAWVFCAISLSWLASLPSTSLAKNTRAPAATTASAAPELGELLDHIIAIVNDRLILNSELTERRQLVLQNIQQQDPQFNPAKEMPQLEKQILERMILETIQLSLADDLGIRINDSDMNTALNEIAAEQGLSLVALRQQLLNQGRSYTAFREQIRTEMLIGQVQRKLVGARIQITEQDVKHFLLSAQGKRMLSAEYRLSHLLIATPLDPTPADLEVAKTKAEQLAQQLQQSPKQFRALAIAHSAGRQALEGGDLGWRPGAQLPSLFTEVVATLQVGEIAGPIKSPSGFHLIKLTDKRGGSTKVVEQTQAQHILIKRNALRDEPASQRLISDIFQRLEAGGVFADLARIYSDDGSNARKGGDLGWVNPGDLVPIFEENMQQTPIGAYSAPFKTQFGWHIVKVTDRRTEDLSNENRDQQAKNLIYRRKFDEELQLWLQEIRQEAYVELRVDMG